MLEREADQKQAMDAAEEILPLIYQILDESVSFYFSEDYSEAARADHDDRAMANCIYSHAERRMIGATDTVAGLASIRLKGLHVLNFRDRALLRFKKVKPNGKHSNYQTRQQADYDDQKIFEGFPDPAFRLTAGYQIDATGSSLERIMIARPMGRSVLWTSQVTMLDDVAHWEDITPKKFAGMEGSDFDAERARRHRGK